MTFEDVFPKLLKGYAVKRETWNGFWTWDFAKETILINTKEGYVFDLRQTDDLRYTLDNMFANDWIVVKGPAIINPVSTFSFSDALRHLKVGKPVRRTSWNDGEFIFIRPSATISVKDILQIKSLPASVKQFYVDCLYLDEETGNTTPPEEVMVDFTHYLCKRDHKGAIINGWTPSIEDIFANDYELL